MDFQILTKAIGELDEETVSSFIDWFVGSKPNKIQVHQAISAGQKGMGLVSRMFDLDEYSIGDLIYAGELMNGAIAGINSVLGKKHVNPRLGKIVLATVEGDLHDIGKNIFKSLADVAGFEVMDLGMDVKPEKVLAAIKKEKPIICGLSAVLTLSIEYLKNTIGLIDTSGSRRDIKIIIGGNAVSEKECELVGADAYTTNAVEGVKICQDWAQQGRRLR